MLERIALGRQQTGSSAYPQGRDGRSSVVFRGALFGARRSRGRGPWVVVLPALIVFAATAGFRFMSPPGKWARYTAKNQFFSAELPGRPSLKRREYESASLGEVREERWGLQVGAGEASTEYFVLRLHLSGDALRDLSAVQVLEATLASSLKDAPYGGAAFVPAQLGGDPARQLGAMRKGGRTLTARAAIRGDAIVLAGVDAAPKGATVLPKLPAGNALQQLFAKRAAAPGKQSVVFEPEPERFLDSFEWGRSGS